MEGSFQVPFLFIYFFFQVGIGYALSAKLVLVALGLCHLVEALMEALIALSQVCFFEAKLRSQEFLSTVPRFLHLFSSAHPSQWPSLLSGSHFNHIKEEHEGGLSLCPRILPPCSKSPLSSRYHLSEKDEKSRSPCRCRPSRTESTSATLFSPDLAHPATYRMASS